jgi:L-cysteine/cystine lyase
VHHDDKDFFLLTNLNPIAFDSLKHRCKRETMEGNDFKKVNDLRDQLPAVQCAAFLNTGTCGPLPKVVADTMAEAAKRECELGRANIADFLAFRGTVQETREALGKLLGVNADTIALTHNTTEGMNISIWGLEWQPGDEIVTTSIEHPGGLYPTYMVKTRRGVVLRFADVGLGADPLPAIERTFTKRTRLLVLSHVSYSSGACFPIKEIVDFAHDRGVMVSVDGAQSAGAIELDLEALGVDLYALSGQKWLCGPEGTGALYVRADRMADLQPTFVGYSSFESQDWQGHFLPAPGAARYRGLGVYRPGVLGQLRALKWFMETVSPTWAYGRIARLANKCRELLDELEEVRVITPPGRQAGLVNFVPQGWSPRRMAGLVSALVKRDYIIRSISHEPYSLRVSTGFYNTEEELIGFRDALGELLDLGPDAIKIPTLAMELPDEPVWVQ